jgi:hypothetical protein
MSVLPLTPGRLMPPDRPPLVATRPGPVRRALRRLRHPRRVWPRVLRTGLLLWAVTTTATLITGDANLVPTVIMLGSFLVPVTCVAAAWEHRRGEVGGRVDTPLVVRGAVLGGAGAVVIAAVVERALLRPGPALYLEVGVIEETAKLAALLWFARVLPYRTVRDGLVLGASVGFGFAGLESAGYAFNALFTPAGLSLGATECRPGRRLPRPRRAVQTHGRRPPRHPGLGTDRGPAGGRGVDRRPARRVPRRGGG